MGKIKNFEGDFLMKKIVVALIIVLLGLVFLCDFSGHAKQNNNKGVLILLEKRLLKPLEKSIEIYKKDLTNEGYFVVVNSSITKLTSPSRIKQIIKQYYNKNNGLIGAVFIGGLAAPLFNTIKDEGDPYWHDYLCDFYYMDINGVWDENSKDSVNNYHKDTYVEIWNKVKRKLNFNDNRTPEIWVSRIRADKLTDLGDEISLLKEYFKKNHNYRTGKMKLPPHKAFVVSAGINLSKSQWGAFPKKLYNEIDSVNFRPNLGDTLRKFLSSKEGYEWGVINVFSGPRIHHFSHFNNEINPEWWKTKEGRKLIAEYSDKINTTNDVSWKDIKSIKPKVLFYHLLTSEVGRHNYPDYLGGMYLFSGSGLAAIAGTQHSGAVGTSLLYDYLAEGNTIGQAWKKALVYLVKHAEDKISIFYYPNSEQKIKAGKSNYKAVLLGDGTLKLPTKYAWYSK